MKFPLRASYRVPHTRLESDEESVKPRQEHFIPELSEEVRAQIYESNYGRYAGWIAEYKGQPVALFRDYQEYEMFWDSYKVTIIAQDETILKKMQSPNFFIEPEIVFRNREFPTIPPFAGRTQPLINYAPGEERATARGLYLIIDLTEPAAPSPPPPATTGGRFLLWLWKIISQ